MKTIAVWGPAQSGKTVLLAQLYLRFHALDSEWRIFPAEETQTFVERMREVMYDRFEFPRFTQRRDDFQYDKVAYEFEHKKTGERVRLFTEDRAGVLSTELPPEELERFRAADGLVIMLDVQSPTPYESQVKKAIERFYHMARSGGANIDARPFAFCLAKADQFIRNSADLSLALEKPDEFVLQYLDSEFLRWIEQYCPNRRLFPVSSVGVRKRLGVVEAAVFYDEQFQLRLTNEGVPIHLATPFEWLFSRAVGK